jgi:hypothetical protein
MLCAGCKNIGPEEEAACSSPLGDGKASLKDANFYNKEMISLIRQFQAPYLVEAFMLPERVESG